MSEAKGEGDGGGEVATLEVERTELVQVIRGVGLRVGRCGIYAAEVFTGYGIRFDVVEGAGVIVAHGEGEVHIGMDFVDAIETHFVVAVNTFVKRLLRNGLRYAAVLAATTKISVRVVLHIVGVTQAQQHAADGAVG